METGESVAFQIDRYTPSPNLFQQSFSNSGRVFGDYTMTVKGNIRVNKNGDYKISDGVATPDPEPYDLKLDDERFYHNVPIFMGGQRMNSLGAKNVPMIGEPFTMYRDADIEVISNREYNFEAWGSIK